MSALGLLTTALSFFGASGGVSIGDVDLEDFEVPEQITWGGEQRLAKHEFPGGPRVIDVMGYFDRDLGWSGMMIAVDAVDRARQLHEMMQDGDPVQLSWGDFQYTVVIAKFECDYKRANWQGGYRIETVVLPDDPGNDDLTDAETANDDLTGSQGLMSGFSLPTIPQALRFATPIAAAMSGGGSAIGAAVASLGAVNAFAAGTGASTLLGQAVATAKNAVGSVLSTVDGVIGSYIGMPDALQASPAAFDVLDSSMVAQDASFRSVSMVGRTLARLTLPR